MGRRVESRRLEPDRGAEEMNQMIGSEPSHSEPTGSTQADLPSLSSVRRLGGKQTPPTGESCSGEIHLEPGMQQSGGRLRPPHAWSVRAPLRSTHLAHKPSAGQRSRRGGERCVGKNRPARAHRPYRPSLASDSESNRQNASLRVKGRAQKEALAQRYRSEPGPQKRPVPILTLSPYRPPAANIGQYLDAEPGYWERLMGWCRRQVQGSDKTKG